MKPGQMQMVVMFGRTQTLLQVEQVVQAERAVWFVLVMLVVRTVIESSVAVQMATRLFEKTDRIQKLLTVPVFQTRKSAAAVVVVG